MQQYGAFRLVGLLLVLVLVGCDGGGGGGDDDDSTLDDVGEGLSLTVANLAGTWELNKDASDDDLGEIATGRPLRDATLEITGSTFVRTAIDDRGAFEVSTGTYSILGTDQLRVTENGVTENVQAFVTTARLTMIGDNVIVYDRLEES